MPKLFLSHSNVDKDRFVRPLADLLRSKGIDVWLDEVEMRPGDDIIQKMFEEGIGKADAVAIILSEASLQSRWVREELSVSVVRRVTHSTRLIPVVLDNVVPPVSLSHLLYISEVEGLDRVAQRIADVLLNLPAKPEVGPEPEIVGYIPRIRGLDKPDELLLRFVCEELLANNGYPAVDRENFIAFADGKGISEERLEESLSALASSYYIEEMVESGSRLPFAVKATRFGFGQYLRYYYPNLETVTKDVVASIVNDGHFQDSQIALAKKLPIALVDFILDTFESDGHVVLSRAVDGVYINQKPTLCRLLR
jgi:hypothetical protein